MVEALRYARNGWKIFPLHTPQGEECSCGKSDCSKRGKHPRISNWQTDATSDIEVVTRWWSDWPDANIGLRLDGLLVLDVDPRHDGDKSLTALEAEQKPGSQTTYYCHTRQRTGSGGAHYIYSAPEGVKMARGFRPGLDLLTGQGCYIVAAPSLHACGARYEWEENNHPLDSSRETIALEAPPQWLLDAVAGTRKPRPRAQDARSTAERVPVETVLVKALEQIEVQGGRNNAGLWFFCQLRDNGYSRDEASLRLRDWVRRVNEAAPSQHDRYTLGEATASLRSTYSRIARKPSAPIDEDAGLTKGLADAILADAHFARDSGGLLYHFEGGVFRPTGARFIERRAKELCETLGKTKSWNPELAARIGAWIAIDAPELWERPPMDTINLLNGLLDATTKQLQAHDPSHLSPVQLPVTFDPNAACPNIEKFVADTFPHDSQHLAWELASWLMTTDTSIQKAGLFLGEGANGKSVWLSLLERFLGPENVSALSLHRIEADKFSASRLYGKLANLGTDLPTAALAGTSMFKALTGCDSITAERKFEASFEFRPFVRLLFSANSAPRSDDSSHGFFRRWLCVPFNRTFNENDPDHVPRAVLDARLSEPGELSGMLNRALDKLPVIRAGRFTESPSTRAALDEFRQTTDPLGVWLDQNTVTSLDATVPKDALRRAYVQVCQDAGRPIMNDAQFTGALTRLRPRVQAKRKRGAGGQVQVFVGLGLRTQETPPGNLAF